MTPREVSTITVADVRKCVAAIAALADEGDNEYAHIDEKALWLYVLRTIAAGSADAQALATEALKTLDLDFERWYA